MAQPVEIVFGKYCKGCAGSYVVTLCRLLCLQSVHRVNFISSFAVLVNVLKFFTTSEERWLEKNNIFCTADEVQVYMCHMLVACLHSACSIQ